MGVIWSKVSPGDHELQLSVLIGETVCFIACKKRTRIHRSLQLKRPASQFMHPVV